MSLSRERSVPTCLVRRGLGPDWWDMWDYPSRLVDQHFGLGVSSEDIVSHPMYCPSYVNRPRRLFLTRQNSTGISEVKNDATKFQVMLDVSHFSPEEITVKVVDNDLVIQGSHEEKQDEHGFVSRHFTRRYMLPRNVEPQNVKSSLSSDGILTVEAPKKALEAPAPNERVVPISLQPAPAPQLQDAPQAPQ